MCKYACASLSIFIIYLIVVLFVSVRKLGQISSERWRVRPLGAFPRVSVTVLSATENEITSITISSRECRRRRRRRGDSLDPLSTGALNGRGGVAPSDRSRSGYKDRQNSSRVSRPEVIAGAGVPSQIVI